MAGTYSGGWPRFPQRDDGATHAAQERISLVGALPDGACRPLEHRRRAVFLIVVQQRFLDSAMPRAHFESEVDLLMRLLLSRDDWLCPVHDNDDATLCRWAAQLSQLSWCKLPSLRDLFASLPCLSGNGPVLRLRRTLFDEALQRLALQLAPNHWTALSTVARADRHAYDSCVAANGLGSGQDLTVSCLVWLLRRRGFIGLREFYPLVRLGRAQRLLIRARHVLNVLYAPGRILRPNAESQLRYVKRYSIWVHAAFLRFMPLRLRDSIGNVIASTLLADGYRVDNLSQLWRMMVFRLSPGHDGQVEDVPRQLWIAALTYAMRKIREAVQRQLLSIQVGATCRAAYVALTSQHDFASDGSTGHSVQSCCRLHRPGSLVTSLVPFPYK
jgi:hypothetical protein